MKFLDKLIDYIQENGNKLDKLRLQTALGKACEKSEIEEVLKDYQFSDGSWDYISSEENQDRVGSLGGTIHCLRWIREFDQEESNFMANTLAFLEGIQESDGSFYETKAKLIHSPQKWLQKETLIDRFYFTAAVPMRLFSLDVKPQRIIERVLHWLKLHWDNWELVASTWYGPWALLSLSTFDIGIKESLYQRCYTYTMNWIPKLEPQPLTWLLDALDGVNFSKKDSLILSGIKRLKELQNKEGLWLDLKYSTMETSITALRFMRIYADLI